MSQIQAKKVSVLIASTLKPVVDVRAFGKLALSLGETNKYSLFIIGFSPKKPKSKPGFRFFSSMSHFDSRIDRVLAQARFLFRLVQVRPKILICCTFELLPIASFFKVLLGYKLVYDVQENYLANLDLNPGLSAAAKRKATKLIHLAESTAKVDLYLLAEKCYMREMPEKRPYVLLENTYQGEVQNRGPVHFSGKGDFKFCITGTLTPAYGILDAVAWFREILKAFPDSRLEIIGHCPVESFREELIQATQTVTEITLRIDSNPIPHAELMDGLLRSDFALLPYHNHPAIRDKMPTKLFECAALGIPVLISPNPLWQDFLSNFDGGFALDFSDRFTAVSQFEEAIAHPFFTSSPPESILWKTEAIHFHQAVQNLLS
jgi:glycosyltransferase involved in cell wall biosynthesis